MGEVRPGGWTVPTCRRPRTSSFPSCLGFPSLRHGIARVLRVRRTLPVRPERTRSAHLARGAVLWGEVPHPAGHGRCTGAVPGSPPLTGQDTGRMIRIDKGGAPGGTREKCAAITLELKNIYAQLHIQYQKQKGKGPVLDKEAIVTALLGNAPSKADKARLLGKLGLVKFGEEIIEVMSEKLLDEKVLHLLQGDWKSRFSTYLKEFHTVALEARKVWDTKLSGLAQEKRTPLLGIIRPFYQQAVLTTGRPWLSAPAITALEIPWFTQDELAKWTFPPALNSTALEFKVGVVAAHQAQVSDFREHCRKSEPLRKYTSLAWMCGTPDAIPAEGPLWAFAFDFHAGYLKKGKHPPRDMGDADLRALATAPEPVRGALAYYVLSVRILGDLIDEKLSVGWKKDT